MSSTGLLLPAFYQQRNQCESLPSAKGQNSPSIGRALVLVGAPQASVPPLPRVQRLCPETDVGLEYLINPRWSAKLEYLYFDLSNNNCCFSSMGQFDDRVSMHTVKAGFNFFLHSQVAPLN